MSHDLDKVLIRPGQSVRFEDRDHLLLTLDRLDQPVPSRHEGRTRDQREQFCIVHYLRFLAAADLLALPVTLRKPLHGQDPPDFVLAWPGGRQESFELTEGSKPEYQRRLTEASVRRDPEIILPVDINASDAELTQFWADALFMAFHRKAEMLQRGHFHLDHLLIYDLTGVGLLLPLAKGAPLLRQKLQAWHAENDTKHRFERVSVLRDGALLLDVGGEGRILRGESTYFQTPVIRAEGEEDLRRRLRDLDRYCRVNSIRHLKAFGSILGDRVDDFDDDSDVDLLVEFEPGIRITLLDMSRMERELTELIGIQVDLRTAGDLSRYFRQEVLQNAVELHASQG